MVCAKYDAMITIMANSCMSPGQIAEKAGVSTNAVYRVRKGYMVKMEIMGKVCALGVKCEDVLDYADVYMDKFLWDIYDSDIAISKKIAESFVTHFHEYQKSAGKPCQRKGQGQ